MYIPTRLRAEIFIISNLINNYIQDSHAMIVHTDVLEDVGIHRLFS
jgi:hypothetical protein